jgi:NAD(P)-dependent dehydrogenase (short-subunit alcohol dehydrogenase family)
MGEACAARVSGLVDTLLLVDRDAAALADAAARLTEGGATANLEPFPLDVTDGAGLQRLAGRVAQLGTLRAVSHAAGISPTMASWEQILQVDLVGTALLTDALCPLVEPGTGVVCFASIAPLLFELAGPPDTAADSAVDDPLATDLLDRMRAALGAAIEDPGTAYTWAKRGVHRLVKREAIRYGRRGGRICSVSPGIIDTPMGRQEAASRSTNDLLVERTPIRREGLPAEVAACVAFLLSDEASFINGIDLPVDGGVVAALGSSGSSMTSVLG